MTKPRVLLLDEPLTALDAATKAQIVDDLRAWNHEHRIPILYVTHDREEVFALGENVMVLEAGRIVARGSPHEVLHRPQVGDGGAAGRIREHLRRQLCRRHPEQGTMTCRMAGSRARSGGTAVAGGRIAAASRRHSRGRHSAGVVAAAGTERPQRVGGVDHVVGAARCDGDRARGLRSGVRSTPHAGGA